MPKVMLNGGILATPLSDHYGLVGTAFDYLLRFYLERVNETAEARGWVAEESLELLRVIGERGPLSKAKAIIRRARDAKADYLKTGEVTDKLLESAILLGQLDGVYRAALIDPNLGTVDHHDVEDLRNLLSIVKPDVFKAKETCILNPVFAKSNLVGGADADFIIDDTLFEVKTTKHLGLRAAYYHQLVGYYILYTLGGLFESDARFEIRKLAIYYSRHALVQSFDVNTILGGTDFRTFLKWFKTRAKKEYLPEPES